jgi:Holliday junction resolvase RusA-like endonuclease
MMGADLFAAAAGPEPRDPFAPEVLRAGTPTVEPQGLTATGAAESRRFELTVEGEATPKLQGDILRFGKKMSIRANPKTRAYEDVVRQRATHVWNGRPLIRDTALTLSLRFYREIPKSFSKRDHASALLGAMRPITKPDCSNYAKAFEDGLKGVIFADDAQVVTLHIEKHYAERPRVELVLEW